MSITITHPNWCTSHIQEDDGELIAHRRACGFETEDGDQVLVTVLNEIVPPQDAAVGARVDLHAVDCDLSPTEARRAAAFRCSPRPNTLTSDQRREINARMAATFEVHVAEMVRRNKAEGVTR